MNPRVRSACFIVPMLLCLVSSRAHGAWPRDPLVNVPLAPFAANQTVTAIVSDGAGGAIVAWYDQRFGNADIYAQHITATGAIVGGWPATGLVICNAAGDQFQPVLVSDGAGGAIVAWTDRRISPTNGDIYAQRVTGAGTVPGGWPVNGRLLSSANAGKDEDTPAIVSDGAGGAIVEWRLIFTAPTDYDVYGARVNSAGTVVWTNSLYAPGAIQDQASMVADGAGGAIVVFEDNLPGNFDIRALRVAAAGNIFWGPHDICAQINQQTTPIAVSDGSGGVIVAWQDDRFGNLDIFASHFTSTGTLVPGWSSIGIIVTNAPGPQVSPFLTADANHGALMTWLDNGTSVIYAGHIQPGGIDPSWPANGLGISPGVANKAPTSIVPDGSGGAIIAWHDGRAGHYDIYATRVTVTGGVPTPWTYGGTPISSAISSQTNALLASDGSGGAILAWSDLRDGLFYAGFAQNVDHFGQLGDASPSFASLRDVRGDQGGKVRLAWNASYLDADPNYAIGEYWIWRQSPAAAAGAAVRAGARWLDPELERGMESLSPEQRIALEGRGLYSRTIENGVNFTWEFLAAQPASGFSQYSYVASTTRDSLGSGNPYTVFMVQARYTSGIAYWSSPPDSSYSVDNLPPLPPAPFTGAYAVGATHLHWGANGEADLGGYRLYRGSSAGFVPGPGNLVASQPDTGYADAGPAGRYYKLSAIDIHGNESAYVLLAPSGTIGSTSVLPDAVELAPAIPNPAHSGTMMRVALPARGRVSLALYDASGRLVRQLADREAEPGEWSERWDGRDDAGRLSPSGLYFARLEAGGKKIVRRIVLSW